MQTKTKGTNIKVTEVNLLYNLHGLLHASKLYTSTHYDLNPIHNISPMPFCIVFVYEAEVTEFLNVESKKHVGFQDGSLQ